MLRPTLLAARASIVVCSMAAPACGDSPMGPPTREDTIGNTIGGVVIERTLQGDIPVRFKTLSAWVEEYGRKVQMTTDRDGRYLVWRLQPGSRVWLDVNSWGLWSRCALVATAVSGHLDYDIVVSDRPITAPNPVQDPPGFRSISGLAFELTPSGPIAVAGASVGFSVPASRVSGRKEWVVSTATDVTGRFHLCGLPEVVGGEVMAVKHEATDTRVRYGLVAVPPGPSTDVSIELNFDAAPGDFFLMPPSR